MSAIETTELRIVERVMWEQVVAYQSDSLSVCLEGLSRTCKSHR